MATIKAKFVIVTDPKSRRIAGALRITEAREKQLDEVVKKAVECDPTTDGMKLMASAAKNFEEFAYMSFQHGVCRGARKARIVNKEIEGFVDRLFGEPKQSFWQRVTNPLAATGFFLWVVYMVVSILEVVNK